MSRTIKIVVKFKQEFIGHYQDRLEVQFKDIALKKQFIIPRMVEAIVDDPSVNNILRPRAPYVPHVRAPWEPELKVIEGVKPPAQKTISYVSKPCKNCTKLDIKFV